MASVAGGVLLVVFAAVATQSGGVGEEPPAVADPSEVVAAHGDVALPPLPPRRRATWTPGSAADAVRAALPETSRRVDSGRVDESGNACWDEVDGLTTKAGCLPAFYLAGLPKCGTTAMWNALQAHPQVAKREMKEHHFWSTRYPTDAKHIETYTIKNYHELVEARRNAARAMSAKPPSKLSPHAVQHDGLAHLCGSGRGKGGALASDEGLLGRGWAQNPLGDGDPGYFTSPLTWHGGGKSPVGPARAIGALAPHTKVVVMLREPGARALSNLHNTCDRVCARVKELKSVPRQFQRDIDKCNGCLITPESWAGQVDKELRALQVCIANVPAGTVSEECDPQTRLRAGGLPRTGHFRDGATAMQSWVGRGVYWPWVREWLQALPREQLYFLRFEDFERDPHATVNGVLRFPGVEPMLQKDLLWSMTKLKPRAHTVSAGGMDPRTRRRLDEFYHPHNARLAELLGGDEKWLWRDGTV